MAGTPRRSEGTNHDGGVLRCIRDPGDVSDFRGARGIEVAKRLGWRIETWRSDARDLYRGLHAG